MNSPVNLSPIVQKALNADKSLNSEFQEGKTCASMHKKERNAKDSIM